MSHLKTELGDGNKLNGSKFHAVVTVLYNSIHLRQQRYLILIINQQIHLHKNFTLST